MAILKIVTNPSPVLRKKTQPVTDFKDKKLKKLIEDMAETMYDAPGVGLAANQVGISLQVAVIDAIWKSEDKKRELRIFINPEILEKKEPIPFEEGCLSLPGVTAEVKRYQKVKVKYQDINGKSHTLSAEGLLAVALQHETDHLNGKLYIDHLSSIKREIILKKYKKLSAAEE